MTVPVCVLGATGAVGQRLVQLLAPHSDFEILSLAASADSAGKPYREAAKWRIDAPIPESVAETTVIEGTPENVPDDVELVFSSMPSSVAERVEPPFAEAGYLVSSNSSNARLADDVPLVIPEVNADHLELLSVQRDRRGWDGGIVKNPNCSTIAMVPPLSGLKQFGIKDVRVATLQAVSGAGYSGVTSMEIIDNVLPHIGGEEQKMEQESRKLLGEFDGTSVDPLDADVSASCNRVPMIDGHLENVWADLAENPDPDEVSAAMEDLPAIDLPSAPETVIRVFDDPNRPQPRLDRMADRGMSIPVGPVQSTQTGVQFDCLVHNTLRGAAGASVLNGELLVNNLGRGGPRLL
jgi:aspartate-semialdehyde dehydrogenase